MPAAQSNNIVAVSNSQIHQRKARNALKELLKAANSGDINTIDPVPSPLSCDGVLSLIPPPNLVPTTPTGLTRAALDSISAQWDYQLLTVDPSEVGDNRSD